MIENGDSKGVDALEKITFNDSDLGGQPLAGIYEEGNIVPQDLVKSYMYDDLGAEAYEQERQRIAKKMTPQHIDEALERLSQWQDQHRSYRPGYRHRETFPVQFRAINK